MKIKLRDAARERLNEITLTKKDNKALRIYVTSIGWADVSFGLALDEPKKFDKKISVDGLDFIINPGIGRNYDGFVIDYVSGFFRKTFTVNPIKETI